MERRDVLHASASALAAGALGQSVTARGSAPFEPVGELEIGHAAEVVLSDDGSTAYVAGDSGFLTVDVSDPANPAVLSEQRPLETSSGTQVQQILDVKVDGTSLLVPTAAQGGGPRGFFLYDVSDPANPSQVGEFFDTPHGNHNSFILDDVVYLTGNTREATYLNVIDVSNEEFEQVGQWSPSQDLDSRWSQVPGKVLHDVWVQDGIAYCAYWDAGTFLVDVSDPANPEFVSRIGDYAFEDLLEWEGTRAGIDYTEPRGNAHYVAVDDDATVLGVGVESWDAQLDDGQGGPGGISLYDITDPTDPTHLSDINPPQPENGDATRSGTWTTSHNFQFQGDRLYTSWYQGGVKTFDVSDPANPSQLSWWRDPAYGFWTARTTEAVDFFAATSYPVPSSERTGLLLFSDEQAEQSSPSSEIVEADPLFDSENEFYVDLPGDFEGEPTTGTASGGSTGDGDDTTSRQTTTPAETSPKTSPSDDPTGTITDGASSGSTPGFGVLAAVAGLGLGASRFLREHDE
ncbi:LVIVD repeat-containing protein [Haloarchaeobius sp. HRN-SO-5]|uniref:LVIVD repeat-containing protein n=1 Tax=Haloarchaeobius sp. HRN-SO-5 TaxID=3446118 RepID=UPI003EC09CBA